jgi:hypothetical protein
VLLNAGLYARAAGDLTQFPRALVRVGGTILIAVGLWKSTKWGWWLGVVFSGLLGLTGILGLIAGLQAGVFVGRSNPLMDIAFFTIASLTLLAVTLLLLQPSTRRAVFGTTTIGGYQQ